MKEMKRKRAWTQEGQLKCYWNKVLYGLVVVRRKSQGWKKTEGNLKVNSKKLDDLSYLQLDGVINDFFQNLPLLGGLHMSLHSFSFVPYCFPTYNDTLRSGMLLLSQNAMSLMLVPGCSYSSLYAPQRQRLFCLFLCISWNLMLLFGLQQSSHRYCWLIGWPSRERECKMRGTGTAQEDSGKSTGFPWFFFWWQK